MKRFATGARRRRTERRRPGRRMPALAEPGDRMRNGRLQCTTHRLAFGNSGASSSGKAAFLSVCSTSRRANRDHVLNLTANRRTPNGSTLADDHPRRDNLHPHPYRRSPVCVRRRRGSPTLRKSEFQSIASVVMGDLRQSMRDAHVFTSARVRREERSPNTSPTTQAIGLIRSPKE